MPVPSPQDYLSQARSKSAVIDPKSFVMKRRGQPAARDEYNPLSIDDMFGFAGKLPEKIGTPQLPRFTEENAFTVPPWQRFINNIPISLAQVLLDTPEFIAQVTTDPIKTIKETPRALIEPLGILGGQAYKAAGVNLTSPKFDITPEKKEEMLQHPEMFYMPLMVAQGLASGIMKGGKRLGPYLEPKTPTDISGMVATPAEMSDAMVAAMEKKPAATPRIKAGDTNIETPISKYEKSPKLRADAKIAYDPVVEEIKAMDSNALRDEMLRLDYKPDDVAAMSRAELEYRLSGGRIPPPKGLIYEKPKYGPVKNRAKTEIPPLREESLPGQAGGAPGAMPPMETVLAVSEKPKLKQKPSAVIEKPAAEKPFVAPEATITEKPIAQKPVKTVSEVPESTPIITETTKAPHEMTVEEFGRVEEYADRGGKTRFKVVGEVASPEQVKAKGTIPTFTDRATAEKYIRTVHDQMVKKASSTGSGQAGGVPKQYTDAEIAEAVKIVEGKKNIKSRLGSESGSIIDVIEEIRNPAGAKRVPFKEAIKAPDRPEMKNMETYYRSIMAPDDLVNPPKMTPAESRAKFREYQKAENIPQTFKEFKTNKGVTGTLKKDSPEYNRLKKEYLDLIKTAKRGYEQANQDAMIMKALDAGVALRTTPGGKLKPSIRRAGTYVAEETAQYGRDYNFEVELLDKRLRDGDITQKQFNFNLRKLKRDYPYHFKDAKQGIMGGTKDFIRYVQEIDGALSPQQKSKLPGQMGPAERYILRRTEDIVKLESDWSSEQRLKIDNIIKDLSKNEEIQVTEVLEKMDEAGEIKKVGYTLGEPGQGKLIGYSDKIVAKAKEVRKLLEDWFDQQNEMRSLRGQDLIDYRKFYAPHILRETSLWERLYDEKIKPKDVMEGPQLPDYINPNAPSNPRAMARKADMRRLSREMRIGKLLENYVNTASRDIHHTSIIQNNKAFIQQLKAMGFDHAAEGLANFTAEGYGGVKARADRWLDLPRPVVKAMRYWRGALMRSVFPLSFTWNACVQTLSAGLTVMRAGVTNCSRGMYDWFANPKLRNDIKSSYSYRVKSQKAGRITSQDVNTGVTNMVSTKRSGWQTAIDGTNYLTELIEEELTGWSIASGLRHGAKRGLRGKALWDYGSDMGAKTQSMYNMENKPGVLKSEAIQTVGPFQTFVFEMYNTAKEFAGKTGTPPAAMTERMGWVLRFTAAAYAGNYIAHAVTGRNPWDVYSFIPFSDQTIKPLVDALRGKEFNASASRGLPSFLGAGVDFAQSVRSYFKSGDTRKIRNWGIKYMTGLAQIPGGAQIARMVDGWIAVADGGMKDAKGKYIFRISDPWEQTRAVLKGPWRTDAGIEYWDKRDTNILQDLGITKKRKNHVNGPFFDLMEVIGSK